MVQDAWGLWSMEDTRCWDEQLRSWIRASSISDSPPRSLRILVANKLIQGKKGRGRQRMRWHHQPMEMNLSKLQEIVKDREAWCRVTRVRQGHYWGLNNNSREKSINPLTNGNGCGGNGWGAQCWAQSRFLTIIYSFALWLPETACS